MFLFEELAITDDQTDVVREELTRLAIVLSSPHSVVVRVHLVCGQRSERWYDYENITIFNPQTLRDTIGNQSFAVMRALATRAKPPIFTDDEHFGWNRVACTLNGAAIHIQVEISGIPSSEAALMAARSAKTIAAQLH